MTEIATNGQRVRAAQAWVYQQYARKLGRFAGAAFKGGVSAADIEDALHDVFLNTFAKAEQFRGESALQTYLYRGLVNHLLDQKRAAKSRPSLSLDDDEAMVDSLIAEIERSMGTGANPESALLLKDLQDCVRGAMATLRQRSTWGMAAIWLRYVDGLKHEEIAVILGRTCTATRKAMGKWLEVMHALLEPCMELRDDR